MRRKNFDFEIGVINELNSVFYDYEIDSEQIYKLAQNVAKIAKNSKNRGKIKEAADYVLRNLRIGVL
ncbi:MAG: hypothetical protein PHV37_01930 [Candidatus Gastranaerophilales bacterium]|nr:hypothetical protein [Candidatus Gastranaerophilales bacterium]